MGKWKVDRRARIENKNQRNVAFCKRRRGLLKKAIEMSTMCCKRVFLVVYDPEKDKFREISKIWAFIDLASKCEMVDGYNIYFANILEYWFAGGTRIDDPEIRIFDLFSYRTALK